MVAASIIPIQLSLTAGERLTLWAPHWVEDGEDWEAFLGHGDALYVFADAAHLAAFIRGDDEHDLTDHPAWDDARHALADELTPGDDHEFDIIGVPELVTTSPDTWGLAELTDTIAILQSLAEVCDLAVIDDVLGASAGFQLISGGPRGFTGRRGKKLWREMCGVIADRWDDIVDALDALAETPEVDSQHVAAAQHELDEVAAAEHEVEPGTDSSQAADEPSDEDSGTDDSADRDPDLLFWDEVGIDCIEITYDGRRGWSLRCYLGDAPVFLSSGDEIQLFRSPAALEEYLADDTASNALSDLDAWTTIREAITGGEASVIAAPENHYVLDGLVDELIEGPETADAEKLELAVELLTDAGHARGDGESAAALSTATPLGNLIRAVTNPDPDRMPPSPPFDDEVAALRTLIDAFGAALRWR